MLDYAANFQSFWDADKIASTFEAACHQVGTESEDVLAEFLGSDLTSERFWTSVESNIRAGKLRLMFVADHIPSELRRIVEFLNKQMSPAEVLALELRQFSGQGLRTIVPVVFGQTREAIGRKEAVRGSRWTEDRLMTAFEDKFSPEVCSIAAAVMNWMKGTGLPIVFGTGRENGSAYPLLKPSGVAINPAYLSTEGKIWLQFKSLEGKPVFGDLNQRRELLKRFAEIGGTDLQESSLNGWASVPLALVAADSSGSTKLVSALDWMVQQVKEAG
jgi:phosphoglycolate phosphatase-like HAD superfamily hydrolase